MQTGQKIASLRTRQNLTQEELAKRLFVSRDLVSKWETGKRRPSPAYIERLAEILGTDADELACRDEILERELDECIPGNAPGDFDTEGVLNSFLASLGERERKIFVGHYYFMNSANEIGDRLGLKPENVRVILSRTRQKLKAFITEELS